MGVQWLTWRVWMDAAAFLSCGNRKMEKHWIYANSPGHDFVRGCNGRTFRVSFSHFNDLSTISHVNQFQDFRHVHFSTICHQFRMPTHFTIFNTLPNLEVASDLQQFFGRICGWKIGEGRRMGERVFFWGVISTFQRFVKNWHFHHVHASTICQQCRMPTNFNIFNHLTWNDMNNFESQSFHSLFSEHLGEIFGGCKFGAATNPHLVPVWTREHGRDLFLKDTNHSLKKHSPKIKKRFLQTTRMFHARFVVWFTFL